MSSDLHRTHQLTEDDLRRLAGAALRQNVRRPRLFVVPAAELVLGVVFLARADVLVGVVLLVLGIFQLGIVRLGPVVTQRERVVRMLGEQGLVPGTVVTAEYFADHFVVAVSGRPVSRAYRDIQRVRVVDGIVVLTVPDTTPMMLPLPLVPDEVRRLFDVAAAAAN